MRTRRSVASFKRWNDATATRLVHAMWPLLDARRRSELADRPRIWRRSEKEQTENEQRLRVDAASELAVEHYRRLRVEE